MLPNELNIRVQEVTLQRRQLSIEGALTLENTRIFAEAMRMERAPTTVLDLSGVPHMDSAGMGALIHFYVSCHKNGRKLILMGVNPRVDELLELTKVKALLVVIPRGV